MKVITGNRVPLKMWLEDIEDSAMAQACDLAMLPFAYHHVALMPDAHTGLGMPIGGVLATNGVVVPNTDGQGLLERDELLRGLRFLQPQIDDDAYL